MSPAPRARLVRPREDTPEEAGSPPWWAGGGLGCGPDGLTIDGRSVAELARARGTPLYVYSRRSVQDRLAELRAALATTGAPTRIYYAMKANRYRPLLETIRAEGDVGIDACSPREVALALEVGFQRDEVSVTASMLSNRDLDRFAVQGVHLNLDTLSALKRYGTRVPRGTRVGLRLDSAVEVGYGSDPKLMYGNTKFGFPHDSFDHALAAAEAAGLVVTTLHVHCGWGLQMGALPRLEWLFERLAGFARRAPTVEVINVGGGLGVRRTRADAPLTPAAWASALKRQLAPLGLTIACEPGTLLVDQAGVLVVEVNTVEEKAGTTWVGVDAGHNINVYMAHYGIPVEIAHVGRPYDRPDGTHSVAGNINESNDVFAEGLRLPRVEEGDLLALLPAGAYGTSMASDHCMRGWAKEVAV